MEETVLKHLSTKDRALLADLFESETMKAIKKSLELFQTQKAHHVLLSSPDHENTILNRGEVVGARFLFDLSRRAFKKQEQKRQRNSVA